jgi:hypothetical protein
LTIVFYHYRNKKEWFEINLKKILYNDIQLYKPDNIDAHIYFNENIEIKREDQKETTRELKAEVENIENKNNLALKENKGQVQEQVIENINNCQVNNFIVLTNKEEKIDDKQNTTHNPKFHIITIKDYETLEPDQLYFDKRSFMVMLKDSLVFDHALISLFFKRSLVDPAFLRLIKFVFELSLQLAFNALFYTDGNIENLLIIEKDNVI